MEAPTTNFTKVVYHDVYPAISLKRPELNQAGRNVLITGGGTGIGKAIAESFAATSAKTVVVVGRRLEVLESAVTELQRIAKGANSPTSFIAKSCDVTVGADVNSVWDSLASQGIEIDVLVLNSAKFTEPKPLVDLGIDEVWSQFEANVKGPLHFAERFQKQTGKSQKFLINVSTAAIHMLEHPVIAARPAYSLTKASGTFAVQLIANTVKPEALQVISFHPGMIWNDEYPKMGVTKDSLPFDSLELAGAFAVWSTSEEAKFLHGRYVLASWDVDELARGELRENLESNPYYLKLAVIGLRDADRA